MATTEAKLLELGDELTKIKKKHLDIFYAQLSPAENLDIFLPESKADSYPVIVYIHGGAWIYGDKRSLPIQAVLSALNYGFAVVSVNYRLSDEAIFPAQIFDIKAAIRWIKANAGKFSLNPDKVALLGDSAGGHLAALTGVSPHVAELEDLGMGHAGHTSEVQAIVSIYAPMDFSKLDEQTAENRHGTQNHNGEYSPESLFLGAKISDVPDKVRAANPASYLTKTPLPSF